MTGADYRATVRLSTAGDATVAEPGETCERVPASSLIWLAEQGLIVPVAPVAPTDRPPGRLRRVTKEVGGG